MGILKEERIGGQRLILGDCLAVMPLLGRFDAVVTDPPYGIGAAKQKLGTGVQNYKAGGDWDDVKPDVSWLQAAAPRICIWGGNYFADKLPPTNDWLIWHKVNDGLSFSECELAWTNFGRQTRHIAHHWGGEKKSHPTMKPLKVMEWCLGFLPDAKTILDPFAGSGTTAVACQRMGRKCTAIELDPDYFEIMCRRVDEAARQPDLLIPETQAPPVQEDMF